MREYPWTVVRGFCMGAADVVPGVSGGTIALLFGIYERLVASVRAGSSFLGHAVRLDWAGARRWFLEVEWGFVLPLLAGIGAAILALAGILRDLLEDHPVEMAAAFLGLVAGSIVVVWQLLESRDAARAALVAATTVVVFVVLGVREGTSEETVSQVADPAVWAFFLAGAVAICAMILPGISGAFILVLAGMYAPVLAAVDDRDAVTVAAFLAGATLGLALFSQVLHWALANHHDTVMAVLVGLMAGSTRVLWPWPDGLDSTALGAPDGHEIAAVGWAVGAAALVIGLTVVADRRTQRRAAAPAAPRP